MLYLQQYTGRFGKSKIRYLKPSVRENGGEAGGTLKPPVPALPQPNNLDRGKSFAVSEEVHQVQSEAFGTGTPMEWWVYIPILEVEDWNLRECVSREGSMHP